MSPGDVSEETERILRAHLDVNAFGADWVESLRRTLDARAERAARFKRELAGAIVHRTISSDRYEGLTGEDFDTPEDLDSWLRELWTRLYGDEPVSGTARDGLPDGR